MDKRGQGLPSSSDQYLATVTGTCLVDDLDGSNTETRPG
jgi:hypothetical protein